MRAHMPTMAIFAMVGIALGALLFWLSPGGGDGDPGPDTASVESTVSATASVVASMGVDEPDSFGAPERLQIPALNVDARVVPVGLTSGGYMDSPKGADDIGWFDRSARPGERGSAVLAGHSGYRSGPAVFDDLPELEEGDRVYVVDEDKNRVAFRVTDTKLYAPDAKVPEIFSSKGASRLSIITCTGVWNPATRTHSKRLVVVAERIEATGDSGLSRHLK